VITIDARELAREIAAELHRLQQNEATPAERTHDTIADFAERMKVSVRVVRKWISTGMPSVKVGRIRRVIVPDAQSWLASGGGRGATGRAAIAAARRSALRAIKGGQDKR
jgi:hypothetical protein